MGSVGFIGLGNIGAPMARHLVDWPDGLVVCDLREEATAPFAEEGARVAATAADVGTACDVVSVMVLDDAQVRGVVAELLGTLGEGSVIAVHSTIHHHTAEDLAQRCAAQGVHLVDAPVSGGFMGAHEGNLAVMIGGTEQALEKVREPFSRWAELVLHMGPVGAGTKAKLARNMLTYISYCAAGEAQRLAEAAGIDLGILGRVVRHSDRITGGPGAVIVRGTTSPMDPDDPMRPMFEHARILGDKDLTLALELGSELDVELHLAHTALARLATELGL
jgi:3-hydroxyisobutyrate dehydrogenase-like beta-hydroxyacid dehydrogenase